MMTYFRLFEFVSNWFWHFHCKKETKAVVPNAFAALTPIQMMNCRIIMNRTTKNIINKYDSIVALCKTQATCVHSPSVLLRWSIDDVSVHESFIHSFILVQFAFPFRHCLAHTSLMRTGHSLNTVCELACQFCTTVATEKNTCKF